MQTIPAPQFTAPRTSRLAITSLVLGCCILLCSIISGLPAVAFGIAALVAISRSRGQLRGQGLAIAGICLGGLSVVAVPILAALLFPAISATKTRAFQTRAAATIQQIQVASTAYYTEYSKWPDARNAADLVLILNGGRDPISNQEVSRARAQNPRGIVFMEFSAKDLAPLSSVGAGAGGEMALVDPWGTPYAFCFDNGKAGYATSVVWQDQAAYDNKIPKPYPDSSLGDSIDAGAAFFSNGPDKRTGDAAGKDDIRSW